MKQFTFTSQLAPIIWKYLESRQNEGYTSVHCGYYMQELDCLSKELSDAPVVTKELIDAWDLLKPYLSNRSKIVRHNAIRAFAKFAYTQDGISYVPDTSKLKNSSTFTRIYLLLKKYGDYYMQQIICRSGIMRQQGIWSYLLLSGFYIAVVFV